MEYIQIKPKHFINATTYTDNRNCPFALALREHFNITQVSCIIGLASLNHVYYEANRDWRLETPLFDGTIYQGLDVDEAIILAKNAPNPELLPTIEVWVKYPK
jgi:hypothetical protein